MKKEILQKEFHKKLGRYNISYFVKIKSLELNTPFHGFWRHI